MTVESSSLTPILNPQEPSGIGLTIHNRGGRVGRLRIQFVCREKLCRFRNMAETVPYGFELDIILRNYKQLQLLAHGLDLWWDQLHWHLEAPG